MSESLTYFEITKYNLPQGQFAISESTRYNLNT